MDQDTKDLIDLRNKQSTLVAKLNTLMKRLDSIDKAPMYVSIQNYAGSSWLITDPAIKELVKDSIQKEIDSTIEYLRQ